MPKRIVTNLVEDQPKVLLIAPVNPVSHWLQTVLEQQHLDILSLSPEDLQSELAAGNQFEDLYKIVWFHQPTAHQTEFEQVVAWLADRSESVVVLTSFTSPISDDRPMYKEWSDQSKAEQTAVEKLQADLPTATLLIGQDVFFSARTFVPLHSVLYFLAEHSLVDPSVVFTLQTARSFCQAVLPNMMSPLPHRVVIQGKKVTSSELVKKVQLEYQRARGILPTVELLVTEPVATSGMASVTNPELEPLSTFVKDVPRTFAISKTKKTEQAARNIQPLPSPVATASASDQPPELPTLAFAARPSDQTVPVVKTKTTPTTPSAPPETSEADQEPVAEKPEPPPQAVIEDQVVQLFDKYRSDHKVKRVEKLAGTTVTTVRKQTRKKKLFWAGLAFVGCGLGVAALFVGFWLSQLWLQKSLLALLANSQTPAIKTPLMVKALPSLTKIVETQTLSYGAVLDPTFFEHAHQLVQASQAVTLLHQETEELTPLAATAVVQFVSNSSGSAVDSLDLAITKAKSLYDRVSQTQSTLKTLNRDSLDEADQTRLSEFEQVLSQRKKALLPSQYLQPLLPTLMGVESKRVYAIVLQNNQELRPTGGFIQAVALVTVVDGVVLDTQVKSVYDWDKQVIGAVTPPGEIIRFLGEQQWYLRDSNWSPDFPLASQQMAWFLERANNGQKIDGVLAINLVSLREILQALGPLDLPEYNEVLTDKNLAERMEFHSEIQLVPGATQDYSTLILVKLLDKIKQIPPEKVPALLGSLQKSLETNQLQVSLTNQTENSSFSTLGWTGALLYPACPNQLADASCVVDVMAQVEANVGVNKANKYISRQVNHTVAVSRRDFSHTRRITYTNTATSPAWPKGTYKNYLRLYVSPAAQLESISINQQRITNDQIVIRDESGRRLFGFLVEVPIGQTVVVEVKYAIPHSNTGAFSYAFFDQRQSGTEDPPRQIIFETDPGLKPVVIAPQAEVKDQRIIFAPSPLSHVFVGAQFN